MFLLIVFVRKRQELFLWMIPLMFTLNNALNAYLALDNWYIDRENLTVDDFAMENRPIIYQIANGSFIFAHWIFGVQYLQTSLILPKCFKNSHLDLSLENFEESLTTPGGAQFTQTEQLALLKG